MNKNKNTNMNITNLKTKHLPNHLNGKINKIFNTSKYNNVEIIDSREKIFNMLFGTSIKINITKLYRYRFYYIPGLIKKIKDLKTVKIPGLKDNVGKVIDTLIENDIKLFLHGGTLRDFFLGKDKGTDIDLVYDKKIEDIQSICIKEGYPCPLDKAMPEKQYILFAGDKGVALEGVSMHTTFFVPLIEHEFTVSDLAYNFKYNILIDITGKGLEDVIYKRIRITPDEKLWNKWALKDYKKPLRYYKLELINFKPINSETDTFIKNFINNNFDKCYLKKLKYGVPRILHFLIKVISQGEIEVVEEDKYKIKFGPLKKRLIEYLHLLTKKININHMKKIMELINNAEIID